LFGITYSPRAPVQITRVLAGSPAQTAGLRRGQEIVAINGRPLDGLIGADVPRLLDRRQGVANRFVVRHPSGRIEEIMVAPAAFRIPPMESRVLPGGIGLLRFYSFNPGDEQLELMVQAIEAFERQGVRAWVLDLRDNGGGIERAMAAMAGLFVSQGRLSGVLTRGEPPSYRVAAGGGLPVQRPMAVLVGPNSASAAEILPGILQAHGRAIVVGEQTAGCIGARPIEPVGLLDGSVIFVTTSEYTIGPNDLRLHRIGITPDIAVPAPTEIDEEMGRDAQLDAAVAALDELVRSGWQWAAGAIAGPFGR
jgi:carboxyl-terminal processing protease